MESNNRKFLLLDPGIVAIAIRKTAQGIWNPWKNWNSELKFHWSGTWNLESRIQACLVFPYKGLIFNAGRYFVRFWRLRHCGKQRKLLEDFKKLAVSCCTKREFCLEALLACICGRLGFKYISLTMWWQGTNRNNNKGREICFWRIHQSIMG